MRSERDRDGSRWRCGAAVALALIAASPACADVYSFIGDDGVPRFSNVPDDPRYVLFLREPRPSRPNSTIGACGGQSLGDCAARAAAGSLAPPENGLLERRPYHGAVQAAAGRFRLDPALIHAVIEVESKYNPNAVSGKGAIGLMQVMPETGRRYGVRALELRVPEKNIATGAQYLADLLRLFRGDVALALAGYNAGERAVARYGETIPPYAETEAYVPRVVALWQALSAPGAEADASARSERPRR